MADDKPGKVLDFTNVSDGGGGDFNTKRMTPGDYEGKIVKVVTVKKKKEPHDEQWCFHIKVKGQTFPYYCGFEENQLWKIRNLLLAAGKNTPKKRVRIDPQKLLVGAIIGVTVEDDEYQGKPKSSIGSIFPPSELEGKDEEEEPEDEGEEEAEESTEEAMDELDIDDL